MLLRLQNDCATGGLRLATRVFQYPMLKHATFRYMFRYVLMILFAFKTSRLKIQLLEMIL